MNDLETFKAITRAVTGVGAENVAKAVARVREILAGGAKGPEEAPSDTTLRMDRLNRAGRTRGMGPDAA